MNPRTSDNNCQYVTCINCNKVITDKDTYWIGRTLDFCSEKCDKEYFDKIEVIY